MTGKQQRSEHRNTGHRKTGKRRDAIPHAISGIEIRILPPFIRDNRQLKIWPFPGHAKLYCLTTVVSDVHNELTGAMDLAAFTRVGKNSYLPVNKAIYRRQCTGGRPLPENVHIMCAIIKTSEAIRDTDRIMEAVKNDEEYRHITDHLKSVVADTASFAVVTNMTVKIANVINRHIGRTEQIATVVDSFSRLHGDWDKPGIRQVAMSARNADFGFEVIVYDGDPLKAVRTVQGLPLFDIPGDEPYTMIPM